MATFRKVGLDVRRGSGYGRYVITAQYRGRFLEVETTDSEIFDWLNDESNPEKHRNAKRSAYFAVKSEYARTHNN